MNYKLNKDIGEQLLSGNIKYKDYKNCATQIYNRITYIIDEIAKTVGYTVHEWNYNNNSEDPADTEFDVEEYSINTSLMIDSNIKDDQFRKYYDNFPSKWLFEDFEHILLNEYQQFENKKIEILNKKKQEEEKTKIKNNLIDRKIDEIRESIFSKLTLEEILYISISVPKINFKNNHENLINLKYVTKHLLSDFNFSNFNNTKDTMLAIKEKVNAAIEDVEIRQLILSYIGSNYKEFQIRHLSDIPMETKPKSTKVKI